MSLSSGDAIVRSTNGGAWQSIATPAANIVSIAVSDTGELYAVAKDSAYSGYAPTKFWKYTTSWSAGVDYDLGETNSSSAPVSIVTDGSTLVGFANTGRVFYSTDDGATWTQGGNACCGFGTFSVIGGYVHIINSSGSSLVYGRWSIATKANASVVTAPAMVAGYTTLPGASVFSTNGSTSELWMVLSARNEYLAGGGFFLFRSTDAGANWQTVAANDLYPANLPHQIWGNVSVPSWFSMGSDNRVHAFGATTASTTATIYEASRGLAAPSDWSATTTVATLSTSSPSLAGWGLQRADGTHGGAIDTWTSVPSPADATRKDIYRLQGAGDPVPVPSPTTTTVLGSLVEANGGGSGNMIVTSPTGTWRARIGATGVSRTSDGVRWENVGFPPFDQRAGLTSIAISDTGELYVIGNFVPVPPYCTYCATALWRYTGAWFGPSVYDTGEVDYYAHPLSIVTDNTTLIGTSSTGRVFYSTDDGNSWTLGGNNPAAGPRPFIIGSKVHTVVSGGSGVSNYSRWNISSKTADAVTTPPAIPQYHWEPTLFSADGSTTDLWIASMASAGGLWLYHSTDTGANWSTVVSDEPFPANLPRPPSNLGGRLRFSMGSDARIHAYSITWASGITTVWEANRGLGTTADWSSPTILLRVDDPYGWSPSSMTTQQVNGVQPAPIDVWFGISNPSSTSSSPVYDAFWVQRNGPPRGGPLTAGEVYGGGHNPAEACLPCLVKDVTYYPVTPSNGNFWHTFDDLSVPGRGMPLHFSHTYNSMAASTNRPLGYGWTMSYNMNLAIGAGATPVTVSQENGSQVTFTLVGGSYVAPPRVQATLAHNGDGTWTFTRRAREIFTFDATGRLAAERDLNGNTTTIAYPNATTTVVTDPAGRTFTMARDGAGRVTSVTDTASPPRSVGFAYDGAGNLSDVTDVGGGVTHFTYDGSHRLLTMLDPNQAGKPNPVPVTNHYDNSGRVDWQSDFMGRTTFFDYTSIPGATKITNPKGNVTVDEFTYGLLTAETKGYGTPKAATVRISYDPSTLGAATAIDAAGGVRTRSFDTRGNVTSQTDPLGRRTTSTYNALNQVTSATDPKNVTTTMTYDGSGNLLTTSTPWVEGPPNTNQVVTYHHDDPVHLGDVTSVTDPLGKTSTMTYASSGQVVTATDPLGNVGRYCYDAVGRTTAVVAPKGSAAGVTCATTAPAAFTAYLTYDAFGHELTRTDPLGHQTVRTFDANGNVKTYRDPDTNTTNYTYNLDGELTLVTRADTTTVAYGYDAAGNRMSTEDGAHQVTTYAFDDSALSSAPTSVTDPLSRTTSYSYDRKGNPLTKQQPGGNCSATPKVGCTTYAHDVANQLTSVTSSDGTTPNITNIGYDADGQRSSMTDGTGTSSWTWDSLHRMSSSTNGNGKTVGYGHDLKGQLTSITYPGTTGTVNRGFDDAGRLRTVTDWASRQTTFNYDADSFMTSEVYPNGTTATFTPDGADRLMGISHAPTSAPSSPFANFSYGRDANDQLTSVTSSGVPADNHTYGYSPLNQLKDVDATNFAYDPADNLTALTDGTLQNFDSANQLASTSNIALVGTGSAASGNTTSLAVTLPTGTLANDQILVTATLPYGKSVSTPTGYTVIGTYSSGTANTSAKVVVYRRTAVAGDTSVTVSFTGKYDKAVTVAVYRGVSTSAPIDVSSSGSTAGGTSVTAPSVTTTAAAGRLVMIEGATAANAAGTWTSPSGMTTRVQQASGSAVGAAIADQPLGAAGATGTRAATYSQSAQLVGVLLALRPAQSTYGYDNRGNRTSMPTPTGSVTLGYDQENRLTGYGAAAAYAYNGDGLRMSKTVSGATTQFAWDAAEGLPLLLTDGANNYVYGPGGRLIEQVTTAGTVTYAHQDQLGSTRVLTNSAGAVVGTFTYDAYGKPNGSTGTVTTPFGWAGEYRDAESGLVYLRARYYDPSTGQFLTRDPASGHTESRYAYVEGDPLDLTDPAGLCPLCVGIAVVVIVVVVVEQGAALISGVHGPSEKDQRKAQEKADRNAREEAARKGAAAGCPVQPPVMGPILPPKSTPPVRETIGPRYDETIGPTENIEPTPGWTGLYSDIWGPQGLFGVPAYSFEYMPPMEGVPPLQVNNLYRVV